MTKLTAEEIAKARAEWIAAKAADDADYLDHCLEWATAHAGALLDHAETTLAEEGRKDSAEGALSSVFIHTLNRRPEYGPQFDYEDAAKAITDEVSQLSAEVERLRGALEQIAEVGTHTGTTRIGDMYDLEGGYQDSETVNEAASIARATISPKLEGDGA